MAYKAGRCRLGVILKARRIKIAVFGEMINMSPSQLRDYISGRKPTMSLNVAMTIASALSIRIEELYEWDYIPPSERVRRTKKE
ncbi:helix-turn-helix transcriptional regulator [Brevibacillus sp. HD3.3A]|uniref:helix-turn-helix domain-containing protein n=1 Tax=Brevibacillus sp. HD3.3A TaxID=2738979 RepID=UPI00156ABF2A|nr:helix-turn-helix transcriptional regulator [Brevibacillus sp. HD3.3A]UED72102.1 helix-turn-helix transcriptional regulator [Brevibacillus sp. HD3.3A]